MKMKLALCVFVFVLGLTSLGVSGLTICKPFSKFRVDCNICTCSEIGVTYTCTDRNCYSSSQGRNSNDNDFEFTEAKPRKTRGHIPYLNDEIPPSWEVEDEENFDTNARQAREDISYPSNEVSSSREDDNDDDDNDDDEEEGEINLRQARAPYKKVVNFDHADKEVDDERDALDVQKELQDEERRINLNRLIEESYLPEEDQRDQVYERLNRDVVN